MSIDQSETVDIISQAPDGTVVLTISDHLEWDAENEHLLLLQEKLNSYFRSSKAVRFMNLTHVLKAPIFFLA